MTRTHMRAVLKCACWFRFRFRFCVCYFVSVLYLCARVSLEHFISVLLAFAVLGLVSSVPSQEIG